MILRRPALKPDRIFLSTYQIRCALRALNEAALLATIWNLRRATKIHGDIFVSNALMHSLQGGLGIEARIEAASQSPAELVSKSCKD